jgi:hypothetical protein
MRPIDGMANRHSITYVTLHAAVPPKPTFGAPCNGCGACCAAEPCPVSRVLLGHRNGACPALRWQEGEKCYRCGMLEAPADHLAWLPQRLNSLGGRLVYRWIAAGVGCDFDAEVSDESP